MLDTKTVTDGMPLRLQQLSALMDGEVDRDAVERTCSRWRDDADLRAGWQVYHLIGDVLRSDELACDAVRSARLMAGVQRRLADEPVPLAPAPLDDAAHDATGAADRGGRRPGWLVPVGMAAAFVAAASVLVVTRAPDGPGLSDGGQMVAQASMAAPPQTLLAVAGPQRVETSADAAPPWVQADGQLVRDVRLDRYLSAHKQFGGSSALGVPSGFLRSATLQVPER